ASVRRKCRLWVPWIGRIRAINDAKSRDCFLSRREAPGDLENRVLSMNIQRAMVFRWICREKTQGRGGIFHFPLASPSLSVKSPAPRGQTGLIRHSPRSRELPHTMARILGIE